MNSSSSPLVMRAIVERYLMQVITQKFWKMGLFSPPQNFFFFTTYSTIFTSIIFNCAFLECLYLSICSSMEFWPESVDATSMSVSVPIPYFQVRYMMEGKRQLPK